MKVRIIPALLGLLVGLIVLALVGLFDHLQQELRHETERADLVRRLGSTRARLEGALNSCLLESQGMVTYIANHPQLTDAEFTTFARPLADGPPPIEKVALLRGTVLAAMYPPISAEKVIGTNLLAIPAQRQAIQRAIDTRKPVIATVDLIEGGHAFIARIPIFTAVPDGPPGENSGPFWGMVSLLIVPETLLADAGLKDPDDAVLYALRIDDLQAQPTAWNFGDVRAWDFDPVVVDVDVPGGTWHMAAVPADHWQSTSSLGNWPFFAGLLLAVLAGVLVTMRASEPQRLHEAVTAATAALRESEDRFRELFENSPDFISLVNEQGIIVLLNRAAAKIPVEQLIGRSVYDFSDPQEGDRTRAGLAQVFGKGEAIELDQLAQTSDGKSRWFRNRITPIRHAGKVVTAMYISTEITEAVAREKALKESEERFRRVFTESPLGMLMVGMDYKILSANAAICGMLGYTEAELTRLSLSDISPPEEFELDRSSFDGAASGADPRINRVKRYRTKSGQDLWANLTGTIMRDNQGKALYALRMIEDITSRRSAEEALKAAERRNRAMLDAIPDILQRVHRDGTYLDFTTGGEQARFVDARTAVGRNVREFFPPETADRFMQVLHQTLADSKPQQFELTLTRDGQSIDYDVRVVVCSTDEVLVLVRNITQAKRSREILRNLVEATANTTGEDFLLTLVRSMAKMLQVRYGFISEYLDPEGERLRMSALWADDRFLPLFEYGRKGTPCEKIGTEAEVVYFPRDVRAAFPESKPLQQLGADSYMAVPLVNAAGKICGVMGIMHDGGLTEETTALSVLKLFATRASVELQRRDTEQALRESEERFRRLSEASFEGIVVHDRGVVIDCNKIFAQLFGLTWEEAQGMQILDYVPPESREEIRQRMVTYDERPYEAIGVRKDGSRFSGEILPRNVPYYGRQVRVTAIRDVTERKRAEEERHVLERQVQHSQKLESLGILAGGIAHDFNNLLTGILGHASLAQLELHPDAPTRATIQQIEIAARRAADLTNQLLAYSGKGKFVVQPVELSHLVHEMAQLLEISIPKKIRLIFDFMPRMPLIDADASQIQQVAMNLITNAADAIGAQNGQITVATGVETIAPDFQSESYLDKNLLPGAYAFLEVRDSGCGMTEETKARIFDPFFTTKFTGRGLGLAAVMGIVRSHHGALQVHSKPNEGTVFRVLLPLSTAVAAPPPPRPKTDRIWIGNGTVLVVDDEESVRTVARMMLQKFGYQVLTASDGREGLDLFRQRMHDINVVLLDMTMPQMSGEEVFREITKIRPGIAVILSSGYSEQEAVSRFGFDGLAGFIQKPYRTMELIQMVQNALNR